MLEAQAQADKGAPAEARKADPFEWIINNTCIDDDQKTERKGQLEALVQGIRVQQISFANEKGIEETIAAKIAEIDRELSAKLNAILHNEKLQRLEGSWRGLHHLVRQSETSPMLKLRVLDAGKDELLQDFERATNWDTSDLFNKVYNKGFGVFGGTPYAALVGDFEFKHSAADVGLLSKIAEVAAAAHAPFIAAASPQLFDMRSFTAMEDESKKLADVFDSNFYIKWNAFRESEDSRYVSLVLPHTLMRLPYLPRREEEAEGEGKRKRRPVEKFDFKEDVDGRDHGKYLWGNAAYAFATRITDAFAKYGWYTSICGLEGGGQVADLPIHTFKTDKGGVAYKVPTEVMITERRAGELIRLGFIPLVAYDNRDYAVFIDAPSCQKARKYTDDDATANAAISADIRCIMAASRFTHYLKAITRDKLGTFMTAKECETELNDWIVRNYTVDNPSAKQAIKSSRPLRRARVTVRSIKSRPGYFKAQVYLEPHIPFKGLSASVSMVAELPDGKQATAD